MPVAFSLSLSLSLSPSPSLPLSRTTPKCHTSPPTPPKLTRRAVTLLLLHTLLPIPIHAEELLDRDLDLDTAASKPASRFGWTDSPSAPFTRATEADYLSATFISTPPLRETLSSYLRLASALGAAAATLAAGNALSERRSLRATLPLEYDPVGIARYWAIRPDKVAARLALFASELSAYAALLAWDAVVAALDVPVVAVRARGEAWRVGRAEMRERMRAVRLSEGIVRMGPAVIKLGQAAASRPDLFGAAVVRELQGLQDNIVEVFAPEEAVGVIVDELGVRPEKLFEEWSGKPIAGASLGMVFQGRVDGVGVAVKVQRPEVAESVALDCYIVRMLADVATKVVGSRTDFRGAVDEYGCRLFEELDYSNELRNLTKFRALYGHLPKVYVPRAFPKYCSRRVLVTEWVDGEKLIDSELRVREEDLPLVETGMRFALTQLLDKGFLHADMHNGNMLRTKSGSLAYIDFGLVSEVPTSVRESIVCALLHLIHGQYTHLAESFSGLALMRSDEVESDLPLLSAALRDAFESGSETQGPQRFTLIGVVGKLLTLGTSFPLVFNDYFLNNMRCLGMLEGLALSADPEFDVLSVVYPHVARKLLTERAPRYRTALESVVIDPYGRMRWGRLEGLLAQREQGRGRDVAAGDAVVQYLTGKEGGFLREYVMGRVRVEMEGGGVTTRELRDEEGRRRGWAFLRRSPLTKRIRVVLSIVPMMVAAGLQLIGRFGQWGWKGERKSIREVRRRRNENGEWRAFDSMFLRRTRRGEG